MLRACLSPDYPLGGAFVKGLHAKGKAPQVLAFVKFLGVYDIDRVQVRPSPAAPGAGAPGTGK